MFASHDHHHHHQRSKIVRGEYEPADDELDEAPLVPDEDDENDDDDDGDDGDGEKKEEGSSTSTKDEDKKEGGGAEADQEKKEGEQGGDDNKDNADAEEEEKKEEEEEEEDVTGIPKFWLTAMGNHELLSELIQDDDTEVLSSLKDIRCRFLPGGTGFALEFEFDENEYFTNTVLTKAYHVDPNPEDPDDLVYQGPIFQRAEGCDIKWNKDKDITVKTVKQKQRKTKGKNAGQVRTVLKKVAKPSFFNFFSPPQVDPDEESPEVLATATQLLHQDYEVSACICVCVCVFVGWLCVRLRVREVERSRGGEVERER